MSSESKEVPELNRANAEEAPMTGEERLVGVTAQLDELLGRGEISAEAFAEYSATADAALSLRTAAARTPTTSAGDSPPTPKRGTPCP
jgi:hypothetical protein